MDNVLWYSPRGSAIVSQVLFTLVVILGILTAVRWQSRRWPRFLSEGVHRTLALSSLIFLAFHVVTSVIDPFTNLGFWSALIPFSVAYRQRYLGIRPVAMYLVISLGGPVGCGGSGLLAVPSAWLGATAPPWTGGDSVA